MTNRWFLLFFLNIILGSTWSHGDSLVDGDFSNGLTGWTKLADNAAGPYVDSVSNPPSVGGHDAVISSTDGAGTGSPAAGSASAQSIEDALDITSLPHADFTYAPTDGQAIYQTFTISSQEILTFDYSFATNDETPYDSVGYSLNGTYNQLQAPSTPTTPTAYASSGDIALQPGTYTLGFIAFNTADYNGATNLYVANVDLSEAPEPAVWILFAAGIGLLIGVQSRLRRLTRSYAPGLSARCRPTRRPFGPCRAARQLLRKLNWFDHLERPARQWRSQQ